jgi:hypothetical protein
MDSPPSLRRSRSAPKAGPEPIPETLRGSEHRFQVIKAARPALIVAVWFIAIRKALMSQCDLSLIPCFKKSTVTRVSSAAVVPQLIPVHVSTSRSGGRISR